MVKKIVKGMKKNWKTFPETKQDFSGAYFCVQGVPEEHPVENGHWVCSVNCTQWEMQKLLW